MTESGRDADKAGREPARGSGRAPAVDAEQLSEMELALTVLWNSIRRWLSQNRQVTNVSGLSDLDVFILHLLVYRNRPMRVVDLGFALSIDDLHQITYSLKKLVRLDMITSARSGKEVLYAAGEQGRLHYEAFLADRQKYLEPSMSLVAHGEHDLSSMINFLRTLSGVYEQAARSAASSRMP